MTRDGGARPAANRPGTDSSVDRFIMVPVDVMPYVEKGLISATALALYVVLLSYHNRTRGDDVVWPSRLVLAKALGFAKPKAVDKYLAELREARLIVSHRSPQGRMNASNRLTLTLIARQSPTGDRLAEEPTLGSTPQGTARTPTGDRQRTPTGDRRSTPQGTRTRGSELDESELEEMNHFLASRASRGSFDDPWAR